MRTNTNAKPHRAAAPLRARTVLEWLVTGMLALFVSGCAVDGLIGNVELPDNVTDPSVTKTPKGALRAYYGTLETFYRALAAGDHNGYITIAGLFTDELQWTDPGIVAGGLPSVDRRDTGLDPEGQDHWEFVYSNLHRVRGQAAQAIGLQKEYAPDSLVALTGHLYALQAYAEIFLADLFCSGIPLSTLDYKGDFTFRPGSTTDQVYEHALALLDTALTFSGDSVRFKYLAQVGQARALLNLGRFTDAATAVAEVPDNFSYSVAFDGVNVNLFSVVNPNRVNGPAWSYTVSDIEGINGLDYQTSGDPRTKTSPVTGLSGITIHHPNKYGTDGSGQVVLASGIEARLIEAEAALNDGDPTWLDKLNHLRQTMWTTIVPAVAGPLPDLVDPGTDEARVDLLYRERAFWLFLTGQRQGDLRRLIRHYGRMQDQVYPTGSYLGAVGAGLRYDSYVDLPVPDAERISNPYYDGCFSRS